LLTFGDKENYRTTDRNSDSSESSEEKYFPVEILENIFLKIMRLQKISVYLLFAQLHLLTIIFRQYGTPLSYYPSIISSYHMYKCYRSF
jgi:hypothetical protein